MLTVTTIQYILCDELGTIGDGGAQHPVDGNKRITVHPLGTTYTVGYKISDKGRAALYRISLSNPVERRFSWN